MESPFLGHFGVFRILHSQHLEGLRKEKTPLLPLFCSDASFLPPPLLIVDGMTGDLPCAPHKVLVQQEGKLSTMPLNQAI